MKSIMTDEGIKLLSDYDLDRLELYPFVWPAVKYDDDVYRDIADVIIASEYSGACIQCEVSGLRSGYDIKYHIGGRRMHMYICIGCGLLTSRVAVYMGRGPFNALDGTSRLCIDSQGIHTAITGEPDTI